MISKSLSRKQAKKHITCNIHNKFNYFGVGAGVVYILQYIRLQIIRAAVIDMKTGWRIGVNRVKTYYSKKANVARYVDRRFW